jgi:triacylglycerol esterase/lipase EstA (alpha/beta hydrolase family)
LRHIRRTLCNKYPASQVFLLVSKSNAGSLSYDGIDRGGERVCAEIESQLREMEKKGVPVKKLSLVGYSLGGLVLRYAAGLLHARKVLQNLQCMASSLSAATVRHDG